ncbi:Sodium/hydrogen exchanger [Apiospora arundinis]
MVDLVSSLNGFVNTGGSPGCILAVSQKRVPRIADTVDGDVGAEEQLAAGGAPRIQLDSGIVSKRCGG